MPSLPLPHIWGCPHPSAQRGCLHSRLSHAPGSAGSSETDAPYGAGQIASGSPRASPWGLGKRHRQPDGARSWAPPPEQMRGPPRLLFWKSPDLASLPSLRSDLLTGPWPLGSPLQKDLHLPCSELTPSGRSVSSHHMWPCPHMAVPSEHPTPLHLHLASTLPSAW